jgi:hypothetical protein
MEPTVVAAIVAAVVVAGLVAFRLRRSAKQSLPETATTPLDVAAGQPIHTADQMFRLLSFQGGSLPADLGPVLEELRRNGIEVDEETLRRKLEDGAAEVDGQDDPEATRAPRAPRAPLVPAVATVVATIDVPVGNPTPGRMPVRVTLELRLPGREPVREHVVAVVADDTRALLVEGAEVPISYDPGDPTQITLAWALA